MNQKPVIIFDWDGTIADSMDLCVEEVRRALEDLKLPPVSEALMRACNGPTFAETVPMLGIPDELAEAYMDLRQKYGITLSATVNRLFPGAKEMLLRLRDKAVLCVASNGTAEYIANCQRIFGTEGSFACVEASKPDRSKTQAVGEILRRFAPDRAVMVGDRLGDINAGKANGLPTICCSFGYGDETEWAAADQVAGSMEELCAMLEDFIR